MADRKRKAILVEQPNKKKTHGDGCEYFPPQSPAAADEARCVTSGVDVHTNDSYTVGWICALDVELAASQAMLDEEHPDLAQAESDSNTYTLGRIGQHNVVIACLPSGTTGTSAAATAAINLLRSFPKVRFGLMVGVGGGAPSLPSDDARNDLRLGDVVVSNPEGDHGGVLQYDYGKTIKEGLFIQTGSLNKPPTVLRTGVSKLRARHRIKGSAIRRYVDNMLRTNGEMLPDFAYPGPERDELFQASYDHNGNKLNCQGCDKGALLCRKSRNKQDPVIHHGLIGSANQVMRHGATREKLREEKGILCFEMEAAGLMDNFPCLVIRGICDYSDTHKNKYWQPYAAATAAAYAKELVETIPAVQVTLTKQATEIVKIGKLVAALDEKITNLQNVEVARIVTDVSNDAQFTKIQNWLSPPDPSTNLNEAMAKRYEGTGSWFLETERFREWRHESRRFLWLYGIPGSGKTVLCSTIIQHLRQNQDPSSVVIDFFFDFKNTEKQSVDKLISSLVVQLYSKCANCRQDLDSLFTSCEAGRREPTTESLFAAFTDMVSHIDRVYIVIDALDECKTRKPLLSWMERLSKPRNVRLLATSRREEELESGLRCWLGDESFFDLQKPSVSSDIRKYIRGMLYTDAGFQRWRDKPLVLQEVEAELMVRANGMFRWAACQLDVLQNCLDVGKLRKALKSLPKTLDETYDRILANISEDYREEAIRILQFLTYSERPLTIHEVVDAIVVDPSRDPCFDPELRMPNPREVMRICSSLVSLVTKRVGSNGKEILELQLSHFSVKEYLTSERLDMSLQKSLTEMSSKRYITSVCLAYLSHLAGFTTFTPSEIESKFPLALYSARYWIDHAKLAETDEDVQGRILDFFQQQHVYTAWIALYDPDRPWGRARSTRRRSNPATPLYYASLAGLKDTVKSLLDKGADVNAQGGRHGTALQAACEQNHEGIVWLLLERGADANSQGGEDGCPLIAASRRGCEKIVRLLLQKGVDVDKQVGPCGNAILAAAEGGHEKIVRLLLENGADINARAGEYDNALLAATTKGHENVVLVLLENGADIHSRGGEFGNALLTAAARGYDKIVQLLLENGANVNGRVRYYGNALLVASARGREKIVRLLLQNGADAEAQGGEHGSALIAAIKQGHEKVARLLIRNGAGVDVEVGGYGDVFLAAASQGDEKQIQLLLEQGVNVNTWGDHYGKLGTALQDAVARGDEKIAQLLIEEGADVNAVNHGDYRYGSALEEAALHGDESMMRLLLQNGADTNAYDGRALEIAALQGHEDIICLLLQFDLRGSSLDDALVGAAGEGHIEIIRLLLQNGANINAVGSCGRSSNAVLAAALHIRDHERDILFQVENGADIAAHAAQYEKYRTALQGAASKGYEGVVRLLIEKGADINIEDSVYGSVLQVAAAGGHERVTRLLLENGAHVDSPGSEHGRFGTALQRAAFGGYEKIVSLLIEKGADVNIEGGEHGSALQAAAAGGHYRVSRLLTQAGALLP